MSSLPLAGKTAFILHSAYGTGLACAHALAEQGARVALAGAAYNEELIEKEFLEKNIEVLYTQFIREPLHISDVEYALETIRKKWNTGVDILVFCTEEKKAAPSRRIERSILSMFNTTQLVLPEMLENNWGRVIHVLHSEGLVTRSYADPDDLRIAKNEESRLHYDSMYAAGMHACLQYSQSLAQMYAHTGIRCHTVTQAVVQSALTDYEISYKVKDLFKTPEEVKQEILAGKNPSQEFISSVKVAHVVQRLCTEPGHLMQGGLLHVDNGWLAH